MTGGSQRDVLCLFLMSLTKDMFPPGHREKQGPGLYFTLGSLFCWLGLGTGFVHLWEAIERALLERRVGRGVAAGDVPRLSWVGAQ